ncbi:hypothetical protein KCU62_g76, partial [Aureobasidium sp. EXF-3399]
MDNRDLESLRLPQASSRRGESKQDCNISQQTCRVMRFDSSDSASLKPRKLSFFEQSQLLPRPFPGPLFFAAALCDTQSRAMAGQQDTIKHQWLDHVRWQTDASRPAVAVKSKGWYSAHLNVLLATGAKPLARRNVTAWTDGGWWLAEAWQKLALFLAIVSSACIAEGCAVLLLLLRNHVGGRAESVASIVEVFLLVLEAKAGGADATVLASAFDALVAVLVETGEVFPHDLLPGAYMIALVKVLKSLAESADSLLMEFVLVTLEVAELSELFVAFVKTAANVLPQSSQLYGRSPLGSLQTNGLTPVCARVWISRSFINASMSVEEAVVGMSSEPAELELSACMEEYAGVSKKT